MKFRSVPFALALLGMSAPAVAACMNAESKEEIAEGRLSIQRFKDAAGRPEQVYILRLPSPACFDSAEPDERVKSTRTLHIFATDAVTHRRIRQFVGKDVHVRGTVFSAHTAHHHAPIVMDIKEIDRI